LRKVTTGSTRAQRGREAERTAKNDANKPRLRDKVVTRRSLVVSGGESSRTISFGLIAIVLVLIFAYIIVWPPLNRYLDTQAELREVYQEVEEAEVLNAELERQVALWQDDHYVQTQARERLGYVMPGETLYIVSDPEAGTAEQRRTDMVEQINLTRRAATPWFTTMWGTVSGAGYAADGEGAVNPEDLPEVTDP